MTLRELFNLHFPNNHRLSQIYSLFSFSEQQWMKYSEEAATQKPTCWPVTAIHFQPSNTSQVTVTEE